MKIVSWSLETGTLFVFFLGVRSSPGPGRSTVASARGYVATQSGSGSSTPAVPRESDR